MSGNISAGGPSYFRVAIALEATDRNAWKGLNANNEPDVKAPKKTLYVLSARPVVVGARRNSSLAGATRVLAPPPKKFRAPSLVLHTPTEAERHSRLGTGTIDDETCKDTAGRNAGAL